MRHLPPFAPRRLAYIHGAPSLSDGIIECLLCTFLCFTTRAPQHREKSKLLHRAPGPTYSDNTCCAPRGGRLLNRNNLQKTRKQQRCKRTRCTLPPIRHQQQMIPYTRRLTPDAWHTINGNSVYLRSPADGASERRRTETKCKKQTTTKPPQIYFAPPPPWVSSPYNSNPQQLRCVV